MKKQASIIQTTFSLILIVVSTFGLAFGIKPSSEFNKITKTETITNSLSNNTISKLKFLYQKYKKNKTVNNLVNLINFAVMHKITDNLKLKNFNLMLNDFLETIVESSRKYLQIDSLYKKFDKEKNWGNLSQLLYWWNCYNPAKSSFLARHIRQLIYRLLLAIDKQRHAVNWSNWFHDGDLSKPKTTLDMEILIRLLSTVRDSRCLTGVNLSRNLVAINFLKNGGLERELRKIKATTFDWVKLAQKHKQYTNKTTISNLKKLLRVNRKYTGLNTVSTEWLTQFLQNDWKTFNKLIQKTIN